MRPSMYIFIVTNSPGELAGWVGPVVSSLRGKNPGMKITVVIPPCQYASGREEEIARGFPGVNYVMGKGEYLRYILFGIKPSDLYLDSPYKGAVLFLGGDPIHALLLSKRLGLPAFSYTHRPRYKRYFQKFMVLSDEVREKFIEEGVSSEKVIVVGDIVGDAVRTLMPKEKIYELLRINPESLCISIFPGSRPHIVRYMTPFYLRTCELIKEGFPEAHFLLVLSPFVSREELTNLSRKKLNKVFQAGKAALKEERGRWKLITESGLKVLVVEENRYEAMSISTLAITIPGTNTHELSYLGIPTVVTIPLNKPEAIPLDGLVGLTGKVPFLGASIKRWIVKKYDKNIKFTAIPNIQAEEEIVPEVRGIIQPEDVAKEAIKLLREPSRRALISCKLKRIMDTKGAADRVAEVILNEVSPNLSG